MKDKIPRTYFTWPDGRAGAVTSSWDDGCIHDPRLLDVFRAHRLRGTFHINSGLLRGGDRDDPFYLRECDVAGLYEGQEIAAHSLSHPNLWTLSDDLVVYELAGDRRRLERIAGYPVTGLAFPCGRGGDDERLEGLARRAGIRTARASNIKGNFAAPTNWLRWGVTCHCADDLAEWWRKFVAMPVHDKLFFWWGHSHEFENKLGWDVLERFAEQIAGAPVWHATNRQIYDYVQAWRGLIWTMDLDAVQNPSALPVWFLRDGEVVEIGAGATRAF
jgi:peptidoglycan/xylan/chitin deacetylase (PgdA/CDA1 family)